MKRKFCLETYVSVDIEAAGPNPSQDSLLSIGACLVSDLQRTFYVELQPVNERSVPETMVVHGLSLTELVKRGLPPVEALTRFETWLLAGVPSGSQPVFVGFNAAFDWMFINDYFYRFLGIIPLGTLRWI